MCGDEWGGCGFMVGVLLFEDMGGVVDGDDVVCSFGFSVFFVFCV